MKQTIPQQTIITCDGCGKDCANNRRLEAGLKVITHVLDYLDTPAARGDRDYDFCDTCAVCVFKVINEELTALRNGDAAGQEVEG